MNKGLGIQFLRHIARSRLLIHVLSLECQEFDKLTEELDTVRNEMRSYDPDLDTRPYFVVANKLDELEKNEDLLVRLSEHFASIGVSFCAVSALTEEGIPELVKHIIDFTEKNPRPRSEVRLYALDNAEDIQTPVRSRNKIQIVSLHGGGYRVLHHRLEKAVERYDLSQDENAARFTMLMRKYKVEDLLEAAGAKEGDQITIGPKDFIFYPDYYPSDFEGTEGPDEDDASTKTDPDLNQ
jgi:GTP-binding protein